MKALTTILILIIILSGCRSVKKVAETNTEKEYIKIHDTITRIETIKDTTFIIEEDKASITALLECDSNNKVILKKLIKVQQGSSIVPQIRIQHDTIILDCSKEREEYKMYYKNVFESKMLAKEQELIKEYNKETIKKSGVFVWLIWLIIGLIAGLVIGFTKKYWIRIVKGIF